MTIAGTGSYVPEKILTNADLENIVQTTDEWIVSRTGIRERRMAAPDEATSHLATKAAQRAMEQAGVIAGEIDLRNREWNFRRSAVGLGRGDDRPR